MVDGKEASKKSDLGVRTISAVIMLAVSGTALWLGGWFWTIFVLLVGAGVWFEWSTLVLLFTGPGARRTVWRASGAIYCGIAAAMLMTLRDMPMGIFAVLFVVGAVVGTDVGAYFAGRAIGGPKIAPRISPSKTWAGLFGGMAGAALVVNLLVAAMSNPALATFLTSEGAHHDTYFAATYPMGSTFGFAIFGASLAVVSQAGDFFESWMKRRAGVKDSGKLIPGHGGLFDRVDGLLTVLFVIGIFFLVATLAATA